MIEPNKFCIRKDIYDDMQASIRNPTNNIDLGLYNKFEIRIHGVEDLKTFVTFKKNPSALKNPKKIVANLLKSNYKVEHYGSLHLYNDSSENSKQAKVNATAQSLIKNYKLHGESFGIFDLKCTKNGYIYWEYKTNPNNEFIAKTIIQNCSDVIQIGCCVSFPHFDEHSFGGFAFIPPFAPLGTYKHWFISRKNSGRANLDMMQTACKVMSLTAEERANRTVANLIALSKGEHENSCILVLLTAGQVLEMPYGRVHAVVTSMNDIHNPHNITFLMGAMMIDPNQNAVRSYATKQTVAEYMGDNNAEKLISSGVKDQVVFDTSMDMMYRSQLITEGLNARKKQKLKKGFCCTKNLIIAQEARALMYEERKQNAAVELQAALL